MLKKHTSQAGDTIVEVLICILVISSVLAGAFVVTNKSLQSVRDSQERAQALKIVESQIERLRVTPGSGLFCLDDASVVVDIASTTDKTCYFTADGKVANPTASPLNTAVKATDGAIIGMYSTSGGVLYQTRITKDSSNLYTVTVRWVNTKSGASQSRVVYRAGI